MEVEPFTAGVAPYTLLRTLSSSCPVPGGYGGTPLPVEAPLVVLPAPVDAPPSAADAGVGDAECDACVLTLGAGELDGDRSAARACASSTLTVGKPASSSRRVIRRAYPTELVQMVAFAGLGCGGTAVSVANPPAISAIAPSSRVIPVPSPTPPLPLLPRVLSDRSIHSNRASRVLALATPAAAAAAALPFTLLLPLALKATPPFSIRAK